ncbi:uncharacterized protein LOC127790096 isoform X2 [Diospyros lotus]|uniref:uncharacterized protein LOC127790096 isoform X2 n=1 Tax=Diospyros lotus TaxID=55363 RepID=UPI002257CC76|nr:uncharacterized protein LOC127790096 isoform X2 [Diospyros lotus]
MATPSPRPREHIEEIRRKTFKIGGNEPDLTNLYLHHAINYLAAELYTKDVHFLMELIQNAEDNEYLEGVKPSLEFVITSRDITATGAPATLLVFNNEKGFSAKNVESICGIGFSTKKGQRKRGYIGEKGIGFKSVFLITTQPYIFSNGYQIRFNEEPCPHCKIGYIVPEWVDDNPTLSTIKQIYGSDSDLPTTTIVLPLKPDKVSPVKQQLSKIHPEVLLFLSKIKRLSVKQDNEDTSLNTVSAISISSETDFTEKKDIDAESYVLHLSADKNDDNLEEECSYYMWRQKFPVRQEYKVERRMEVEEYVITLAFPNGQRLNSGTKSPGVYAFLPTEMVTTFPFIIQADFLLASSRETILLDNKWNQGILEYVPSAFINAFISLVKTIEGAPVSTLARMFEFLPINIPPYPALNAVRDSIKAKLVNEDIVPCESYMEKKLFWKPSEVGVVMPAFWNILNKARKDGVSLDNISSHGRYVLSSSFDTEKYDQVLNFLGVKPVEDEWYVKCIRSSNLIPGVSEEVYLELLVFVAKNWRSNFQNTNIKDTPLLKYESYNGDVSLFSINVSQSYAGKVLACEPHLVPWLIDWNREFGSSAGPFFIPKSTQEAILQQQWSEKQILLEWLSKEVKVQTVSVYDYAALLVDLLKCDRKRAVTFVHFLYHSLSRNNLSETDVGRLCCNMPLVDNYGQVTTQRNRVLVPANGSKWVRLIGSNPWRAEGFIELADDYRRPVIPAGVLTPEEQLIPFLRSHIGASDVPDVSPPNAVIPTMSAPLTKDNTFLLLGWIRSLMQRWVSMPKMFSQCIKEGSWMRVSLGSSPGYRPPSQSFLPNSLWGHLLQNENVLVDIPIIDLSFYGCEIMNYKVELGEIGVMFHYGEACQFFGKHLMSLAASSALTRGNVFSILKFINFMRERSLSARDFIQSIREGKWLRTSLGNRSPVGSVLFDQEWETASQISAIPFIDKDYYGEEILQFKTELQMLGVVVGWSENYQLVAYYLKPAMGINVLTAESGLFILNCMRHLGSPDKLIEVFKDNKFLKTSMGYTAPVESHLISPEWGCLLQIFNSFALIDENFYGSSIFSYKNELRELGVVVDFNQAKMVFAHVFRLQGQLSNIGKEHAFSLLACYRKFRGTSFEFSDDLMRCILEVKWLRTRLGDLRIPGECILFRPHWESISCISLLPFIDDADNWYGKGIYEYEKELESMGVKVAFKDGCGFVATGLKLPFDPSCITPANAYSLLECIRTLRTQNNGPLPDSFLTKVSQKWLKTSFDYRPPGKCLLYNFDWKSLQRMDGPFIDEEFYGSNITSYAKELNAIGVTIDVRNGGPLLANHLHFCSNFSTIVRIYSYLQDCNWNPETGYERKIWIPSGSDDGEWVAPQECVLRDKDGLFDKQLNVLEKHYGKELLLFFSSAFGVKPYPSLVDYCELWKEWELCGRPLTLERCCAFWKFVVSHCSSETLKRLAEHLMKLPAYSVSDEILLIERLDVFIADDLHLKDLFEQSSSQPLFAWYPQSSIASLPRFKLLEVYSKIGVRNLSESVQKEEMSITDGAGLQQVSPREILIGKGLLMLILSFLAGPALKMEAENRHEVVRCLLNLTVFETAEPVKICYSLLLSSGEKLKAEATPMIRWERENKELFAQKMNRSGGHRSIIEYATSFSEVISAGLLWENEDQMHQLAELIKLGFLLEFDEQAIGFLMKTKNLQLFAEDERFLSSAFPSD